jgi:predicted regulator of Ras-like GTPase activity (Roadblock/LC7/MglB family)/type II secretory pathway predicted ATPase ExeA
MAKLTTRLAPVAGGPNESDFYSNQAYARVIDSLLGQLQADHRLALLLGDAGTGKTTVIQQIIERLGTRVHPVFFSYPPATFADFLSFSCEELGLTALETERQQIAQANAQCFQDYLNSTKQGGQRVVCFIDDAQDVAEDVLTEILQFAWAEYQPSALFQFVLAGLPELEERLHQPGFQARGFNSPRPVRLLPLQNEEIGPFVINHAVTLGRWKDGLFSPEAMDKIASYSRGIPRLIKLLCRSSLFTADLQKQATITADTVQEAAALCSLALESGLDDHVRSVPVRTPQPRRTEDYPPPALTASKDLISVASEDPRRDELTTDFAHAQEEPMDRVDNLNKVLRTLRSGSPDVEATALISEDGLMIASALPQDLDETRVAGMTATLLSLGTRAAAELGRGEIQEVIVRGAQGYAVMIDAGRGTLLLVVANENAKLGLIFFDMRDAIKAIKQIL